DGSDGNTIGGTTTGARNIISGNINDGVLIHNEASANLVEGNFIGTNPKGTALHNQVGVVIDSDGNTIGGTTPGAGNVISGNTVRVGIDFLGDGNVIQGNRVGTNPAGNAALSNSIGIRIASSGNTIGGAVAGADNVISGNNFGIFLATTASQNLLQGNFVGT